MAGVVFGAMLAAAITANLAREDGMKGSTVLLVESPSLAHWRMDLSIWQVGGSGEPPVPREESRGRPEPVLPLFPEVSEGEIADLFIDAGVTAPTPATPVSDRTVEPTAVAAASAILPAVSGCPRLIEEALGRAGCLISWCESGWNPNALGAIGERGWFQVAPQWHYDSTFDQAGNVAAAVRISSGGTDWSAWTTRGVLTTGRCPNGVIPPW